jgi:hypothetical protein
LYIFIKLILSTTQSSQNNNKNDSSSKLTDNKIIQIQLNSSSNFLKVFLAKKSTSNELQLVKCDPESGLDIFRLLERNEHYLLELKNNSETLNSHYLLTLSDKSTVNVSILNHNQISTPKTSVLKYNIQYILRLSSNSSYGLIKSDMSVIVVAIVRFTSDSKITLLNRENKLFEVKPLSTNYYMIKLTSNFKHNFQDREMIDLNLETLESKEHLRLRFKIVDKNDLIINLVQDKLVLNVTRNQIPIYGLLLVHKIESLINADIFVDTNEMQEYKAQFLRYSIHESTKDKTIFDLNKNTGILSIVKNVPQNLNTIYLNISIQDTNKNLFRLKYLEMRINFVYSHFDSELEIRQPNNTNSRFVTIFDKTFNSCGEFYLRQASQFEHFFHVNITNGILMMNNEIFQYILHQIELIHIEIVSYSNNKIQTSYKIQLKLIRDQTFKTKKVTSMPLTTRFLTPFRNNQTIHVKIDHSQRFLLKIEAQNCDQFELVSFTSSKPEFQLYLNKKSGNLFLSSKSDYRLPPFLEFHIKVRAQNILEKEFKLITEIKDVIEFSDSGYSNHNFEVCYTKENVLSSNQILYTIFNSNIEFLTDEQSLISCKLQNNLKWVNFNPEKLKISELNLSSSSQISFSVSRSDFLSLKSIIQVGYLINNHSIPHYYHYVFSIQNSKLSECFQIDSINSILKTVPKKIHKKYDLLKEMDQISLNLELAIYNGSSFNLIKSYEFNVFVMLIEEKPDRFSLLYKSRDYINAQLFVARLDLNEYSPLKPAKLVNISLNRQLSVVITRVEKYSAFNDSKTFIEKDFFVVEDSILYSNCALDPFQSQIYLFKAQICLELKCVNVDFPVQIEFYSSQGLKFKHDKITQLFYQFNNKIFDQNINQISGYDVLIDLKQSLNHPALFDLDNYEFEIYSERLFLDKSKGLLFNSGSILSSSNFTIALNNRKNKLIESTMLVSIDVKLMPNYFEHRFKFNLNRLYEELNEIALFNSDLISKMTKFTCLNIDQLKCPTIFYSSSKELVFKINNLSIKHLIKMSEFKFMLIFTAFKIELTVKIDLIDSLTALKQLKLFIINQTSLDVDDLLNKNQPNSIIKAQNLINDKTMQNFTPAMINMNEIYQFDYLDFTIIISKYFQQIKTVKKYFIIDAGKFFINLTRLDSDSEEEQNYIKSFYLINDINLNEKYQSILSKYFKVNSDMLYFDTDYFSLFLSDDNLMEFRDIFHDLNQLKISVYKFNIDLRVEKLKDIKKYEILIQSNQKVTNLRQFYDSIELKKSQILDRFDSTFKGYQIEIYEFKNKFNDYDLIYADQDLPFDLEKHSAKLVYLLSEDSLEYDLNNEKKFHLNISVNSGVAYFQLDIKLIDDSFDVKFNFSKQEFYYEDDGLIGQLKLPISMSSMNKNLTFECFKSDKVRIHSKTGHLLIVNGSQKRDYELSVILNGEMSNQKIFYEIPVLVRYQKRTVKKETEQEIDFDSIDENNIEHQLANLKYRVIRNDLNGLCEINFYSGELNCVPNKSSVVKPGVYQIFLGVFDGSNAQWLRKIQINAFEKNNKSLVREKGQELSIHYELTDPSSYSFNIYDLIGYLGDRENSRVYFNESESRILSSYFDLNSSNGDLELKTQLKSQLNELKNYIELNQTLHIVNYDYSSVSTYQKVHLKLTLKVNKGNKLEFLIDFNDFLSRNESNLYKFHSLKFKNSTKYYLESTRMEKSNYTHKEFSSIYINSINLTNNIDDLIFIDIKNSNQNIYLNRNKLIEYEIREYAFTILEYDLENSRLLTRIEAKFIIQKKPQKYRPLNIKLEIDQNNTIKLGQSLFNIGSVFDDLQNSILSDSTVPFRLDSKKGQLIFADTILNESSYEFSILDSIGDKRLNIFIIVTSIEVRFSQKVYEWELSSQSFQNESRILLQANSKTSKNDHQLRYKIDIVNLSEKSLTNTIKKLFYIDALKGEVKINRENLKVHQNFCRIQSQITTIDEFIFTVRAYYKVSLVIYTKHFK